ncbi:MAG: hypothetical protein K0R09_3126 [Clostridiales bacterium]|nr:hypothetical protein [Clostridiales bacterium]
MGKITSPQNKLMAIVGKWEIERGFNSDFTEMTEETKNKWVGKTVQFSDKAVLVREDVFNEPQYKVKKVNTEDYLLYRHKQSAEKYGIKDNEVYVITIAVKELYSFDTIVIDDGKLIIEFEDYIFYLKKLSNTVDSSLISKFSGENENDNPNIIAGEIPAKTGLVIGLKYPGKDREGKVEYKYRTLWVGSEDRLLRPVLETGGIFFPRHDGFWRIETKRITAIDKSEDAFYGYSVINGSTEGMASIAINSDKWGDRIGRITRSISYICNNYIGIESIGEGGYTNSNAKWNENWLQLQLVDNLPNLKSIKIYDIVGEAGNRAIKNGNTEALGVLDLSNINQLGMVYQNENYGLFRKAGHWLFKGRINYEENGEFKFSDFNINIIPPPELVFYDELSLSWTQIKDRVPEALDAYTSPNKDIAIIVTKERLLIYDITMGTIGATPIKRIGLKNGETVIMAEWARGSYMDNWEKSFMKNEIQEVK